MLEGVDPDTLIKAIGLMLSGALGAWISAWLQRDNSREERLTQRERRAEEHDKARIKTLEERLRAKKRKIEWLEQELFECAHDYFDETGNEGYLDSLYGKRN